MGSLSHTPPSHISSGRKILVTSQTHFCDDEASFTSKRFCIGLRLCILNIGNTATIIIMHSIFHGNCFRALKAKVSFDKQLPG
jgi:hypothetical protein